MKAILIRAQGGRENLRLEEIEKDYSEQKEINEELLNRKERNLKKKFTINKQELADEIIVVFGFEYVP